MQLDERGFFYPHIEEDKCIDCGMCQKFCIRNQKYGCDNEGAVCQIGVHKDENIWMNSSSGGAFTAIVQALENNNPIIGGVCYDGDMCVKHEFMDASRISKMRKSKYVQSDMRGVFETVENFLKEGRYVIFTGTPCQISGLYAAIGKKYEKLYTIDLVCTGVMSQKIWQEYVLYLEKYYGKRITNVDMRYKVKNKNGWNIGDTEVGFEDGTRVRSDRTRLYRKMYGQKVAYRDACYNCQFARLQRESDMTIGDWWGDIEALKGKVKEHKGISLIIGNTQKGKIVLDALKDNMFLVPLNIEDAIADNPTLSHATRSTRRNGEFWNDAMKMRADKLLRKYSRPEFIIYVLWFISRMIPTPLRGYIKKTMRK